MAAPPQIPRLPSGAPAEVAPQTGGFAIRLPSAQLGDLIQINCMNRVRAAFRLSSGHQQGYLFFDAGQLIHAELEAAVGLDAVVQMLGLRGGSIEPCSRAWPRVSTIDMGADALLLSAAQRLDEMPPRAEHRDQTTKVVRRVAGPEELAKRAVEVSPAVQGLGRSSSAPDASAEQLSQLQIAQVSFDGAIRQLRSGASAELADTAFFSERMAGKIGETLGLGECRALAFEGPHEGIVVFKGRSIVGARGKTADLDFILAKVGLK
jgi:hypothetical protein